MKTLQRFLQMKISISGIRGIFGKDLTLKEVIEFCNNFSILVPEGKCVIANDTRPSSDMIRETAKASLMECGIDVYDLGMSPTPVVFRESRKFGAGLMITSSHNPLEWNGLKFLINGRMPKDEELEIITNTQQPEKSPFKIGTEEKIESDYVDQARNLIGSVEGNPKVAVDIGGGAARNYAPLLLSKIGCDVSTINENLEGSTRGPDPTAEDLRDLIVASENRDIGFAFDLDGDRLVVVKNGVKQTPDVTLGLGTAKAFELGCKKFVLSLDTSISVEKFLQERGCQVKRSKVGELNVIQMMLETGSEAGGEGSSGGFIFPSFNYCREGLLTSGLIASMLNSKIFDEVLDFMKNYVQIRDKIPIPSDAHDLVLENFSQIMKKEYSEINEIDGIKGIIDDNSWVLVRKSNTEDIIRISAESNNPNQLGSIVENTKTQLKQSYEKIK